MIRRLSLLSLVMITACAAPVLTSGIPNFQPVSLGVWRGGQPADEGIQYLDSLGVTRIIKLNPSGEAGDYPTPRQTVYSFPVSMAQQMGVKPIRKDYFDAGLALVGAGTFIHCTHGEDRTGLFVAMLRVKVQGWPKARAEQEMLALGFHKELIGIWEFWKDWQP